MNEFVEKKIGGETVVTLRELDGDEELDEGTDLKPYINRANKTRRKSERMTIQNEIDQLDRDLNTNPNTTAESPVSRPRQGGNIVTPDVVIHHGIHLPIAPHRHGNQYPGLRAPAGQIRTNNPGHGHAPAGQIRYPFNRPGHRRAPPKNTRDVVFGVNLRLILGCVLSISDDEEKLCELDEKVDIVLDKMRVEQRVYTKANHATNTRVDQAEQRSRYVAEFLAQRSDAEAPSYAEFIDSFDLDTGKIKTGTVASFLKNGSGLKYVVPFLRNVGLVGEGNGAVGLRPYVLYKALYALCLAVSPYFQELVYCRHEFEFRVENQIYRVPGEPARRVDPFVRCVDVLNFIENNFSTNVGELIK